MVVLGLDESESSGEKRLRGIQDRARSPFASSQTMPSKDQIIEQYCLWDGMRNMRKNWAQR